MKNPMLCGLAMVWGLSSCSGLYSMFDGTDLVWDGRGPVEEAPVPEGFVVSPQEAVAVAPLTKVAWNVYADDGYYYLSSALSKLSSSSGSNSYLAKTRGLRLQGTERAWLERRREEGDRFRRFSREEAAEARAR